jgi:hypothetical protein
MELDDFNCSLCNYQFNLTNKLPRLLIQCGHTFCHECLQQKLYKNLFIICPEDNNKYEKINKIEDLPKNITVINLIQKLENRKYLGNHESNLKIENPLGLSSISDSFTPIRKSHTPNISRTVNDTEKFIFSPPFCEQGQHIQIKTSNKINRDSIFSHTSDFKVDCPFDANFCIIHKRQLEIICLDDRMRICTSCALFGEHKNHNLRSEDDILREVSLKAEILIEFYEFIGKQTDKIENDENKILLLEAIKMHVIKVSENKKNKMKNYFKELRFLLKTKEKELIEEIEDKYEKTFEKKAEEIEKIFKNIKNKVVDWKKE